MNNTQVSTQLVDFLWLKKVTNNGVTQIYIRDKQDWIKIGDSNEVQDVSEDGIYFRSKDNWIKLDDNLVLESTINIHKGNSNIVLAGGGSGQKPLAAFKTNDKFGGFVEFHIDGDGSGAGGGLRFYHKDKIRLQVLTGNPDYAYSEGVTFDVLDGNLGFVVRNPDGLVKFTNNPSKGSQAKVTFDVNTGKILVNGNGYSQIVLQNSYTPTSSNDVNGDTGSLCYDNDYIYVKTSKGWKRSSLESF